jgi:hypothetical protein
MAPDHPCNHWIFSDFWRARQPRQPAQPRADRLPGQHQRAQRGPLDEGRCRVVPPANAMPPQFMSPSRHKGNLLFPITAPYRHPSVHAPAC